MYRILKDVAICMTWIIGIPFMFLALGIMMDIFEERRLERDERRAKLERIYPSVLRKK